MPAPSPSLSIHARTFAANDPGEGGWKGLLETCRAADIAGVDRIAVSDHIAMGEALDAYGNPGSGGTEGGKQPTGPDGHWLEPLTFLSVVAGCTSRVRLHTSILLAALRRPAVLAKSLATLDVLSEGRVDVGVGVGWQKEEYEAAGLPFAGRGRLLNDTLEVCQKLWTEQVASHTSEHLTFSNIHAMPKPLQSGGVPIWVSGRVHKNVLDRIVRFGSGWIPWGADVADPTASLQIIRQALTDAGRDPNDLAVAGTLPIVRNDGGELQLSETMDRVPALRAAGITDFRAYVAIPTGEQAAIDYLSPIVAAFRSAAEK